MRTIGHRAEVIQQQPSTEALRAALAHQSRMLALTPDISTGIPKGVYPFRSHEEADAHRLECLARVVAAQAALAKPLRGGNGG